MVNKLIRYKFGANENTWILLVLFVSCLFMSSVVPPLKSPDEHDHIERAYLLGKGIIILSTENGQASGGKIDTALLEYLRSYPPYPEKLHQNELFSASELKWSGERTFDSSPGTGYYFPLIYAPQAIGLIVGEMLDLSIDLSYRLARAFSLISIIFILYAAFSIYPTNPLVLALISLPMTLFQFASASLDGIATALAIFTVSAFLRITKDRNATTRLIQYTFALGLAILASSRIHTLPLLLLLFAAVFYTKNKLTRALSIATTLFVAGWTFIAMANTVDFRVSINDSTSNIILYYILNPLQFFAIVINTISSVDLLSFYFKSFVGILGWLDIPFERRYYNFFLIILGLIFLLSISVAKIKSNLSSSLILAFISLTSALFVFFALLVTWTPHPAHSIAGIQGRYFLIPSIVLAYGLGSNTELFLTTRTKLASFLVLCLLIGSVHASLKVLINRYYVTPFRVHSENIELDFSVPEKSIRMTASHILEPHKPIKLLFSEFYGDNIGKTVRLGLRFGTHMRNNQGQAELVLIAINGETYRQKFTLSDLIDNEYRYFYVPTNYYYSGQVKFLTGGGISIWEVHSEDGNRLSCLKFITTRNQHVGVKGCP